MTGTQKVGQENQIYILLLIYFVAWEDCMCLTNRTHMQQCAAQGKK